MSADAEEPSALPDLGVAGKVVLITGAARGLGEAFAKALAEGGATVALLDRDGDAVRSTAETLARTGARTLGLTCDVTDPTSAAAAVDAAIDAFGRIDGLINNAGINMIGPSENADPQGWRRVIDVNLFGGFVMSQQVGRRMLQARSGSIINMASIHAHVAPSFHAASAYSASKAGLLGLTRALAVEWGRHGVRVNALAPGFIRTEMTRERLDDPTYAAAILDRSPLRIIGEPRDLIGAVLYLLSDASRLVTGQALGIDAGWVAI